MSRAPNATLRRRHQLVREAAARYQVDALVVTTRSNILYLTNFTGSSAIVVLTPDRVHFITDFRYLTAIESQQHSAHACPDLDLVVVDGSYDATLAKLVGSLDIGRIGFEAANVTVSRHAWLTAAFSNDGVTRPELVPTDQLVERLRVRKDEYEIETLREAARMLSEVALGVFEEIGRGRSERDVALAVDARIRRAGFERPAFDTIVASGPHSALPHATPGERTLSENDLVVLDFGGVYHSYCVDLTRTVSVGRAGDRAREVYAAVLEAHDRAIRVVEPGTSRFAIDAAARDWLTARGLGEAFGHGTGHGLGIDIHEDPRITRPTADANVADAGPGDGDAGSETDDRAVTPGMVFTIEPGAYLAGWGGVRIEDDVLVTQHGVERTHERDDGPIGTVNLDDVREILALMRDNGLSEFEIESEGLKLRLRKDSVVTVVAAPPLAQAAGVHPAAAAAPAHAVAAPGGAGGPAGAGPQAADAEIELAVVKSPIVGTFYRSSEPAAPSFVEIGSTVKKGQVLCIIEAMKLMNEIDSEYDGEIVNIYVENGQPVQYGERLFAIRTT